MGNSRQDSLFPRMALPHDSSPQLAADASIMAAISGYEKYLADEAVHKNTGLPLSPNTQKAFLSDIRLLGEYLGIGQPVSAVGTSNLNDFLNWLQNERGIPCSRKSYSRRVKSLKHFFDYVVRYSPRTDNPADPVIQISVSSPLPTLPTEPEIDQALATSMGIRRGHGGQKPDARPHLLLTLLLQTGVKKQEVMRIVLYHIVQDDPQDLYLFVPYSNARERVFKERRMLLESEWLDTLDEYLDQYQPSDTLFTCTPRNLEYVLTNIAAEAALEKGSLTFENLRWIFALRLLRRGEKSKTIQRQLGLFDSSWREVRRKLEQLLEKEGGKS